MKVIEAFGYVSIERHKTRNHFDLDSYSRIGLCIEFCPEWLLQERIGKL